MMQKYGKLLINLNNPVILTFDNGLARKAPPSNSLSPNPSPRREGVEAPTKPPPIGEALISL